MVDEVAKSFDASNHVVPLAESNHVPRRAASRGFELQDDLSRLGHDATIFFGRKLHIIDTPVVDPKQNVNVSWVLSSYQIDDAGELCVPVSEAR